MKRIAPESWNPADGFDLEPNALEVVRSLDRILVTAGPGAGKTELLAQRADYLLRTGRCPFPRKILAVSLKVDAASNLRDRVADRCKDDADRFESVTLDAFSKRLVDRFRLALPPEWQPVADYAPRLRGPTDSEIGQFLNSLKPPTKLGNRNSLHGISRQGFIRRLSSRAIPWPEREDVTLEEWVYHEYWRWAIEHSNARDGSLPFSMLARLAELVLRINPKIVKSLRAAYAYVFFDEFQDMTYWHYDIVRMAFRDSQTVATAVGDTKQRIMVWAGADPQVGEKFVRDFEARRIPLYRNHRAAPALVRVLNSLSRVIEHDAPIVEAADGDERDGVCVIHRFADTDQESAFLSELICDQITEGIDPQEHCIIVRQRCDIMSEPVITKLRAGGIQARDETLYQDLLKEVLVDVVLSAMILADGTSSPGIWTRLCEIVRHADDQAGGDRTHTVSSRVQALVKTTAEALESEAEVNQDVAKRMILQILEAFGEEKIRAVVPAYQSQRWFDQIINRTADLISLERERSDSWSQAANQFYGDGVVPAMTIHKSKGLEYDTVCFVGLEDSSWWAFARDPDENTRSFFVAFSRAKRRVVFTFAATRDAGRGTTNQTSDGIRPLYDALEAAGVPTIDHV